MNQQTISLKLAQELKEAGLVWKADINDFFAIPDRAMDERVFVVSDLQANLNVFRGWPVVTFHGTAEWALDYILTQEVVWLPTEGQVRHELEEQLQAAGEARLELSRQSQGYRCGLRYRGQDQEFQAATAGEAYGHALLYVLESQVSV